MKINCFTPNGSRRGDHTEIEPERVDGQDLIAVGLWFNHETVGRNFHKLDDILDALRGADSEGFEAYVRALNLSPAFAPLNPVSDTIILAGHWVMFPGEEDRVFQNTSSFSGKGFPHLYGVVQRIKGSKLDILHPVGMSKATPFDPHLDPALVEIDAGNVQIIREGDFAPGARMRALSPDLDIKVGNTYEIGSISSEGMNGDRVDGQYVQFFDDVGDYRVMPDYQDRFELVEDSPLAVFNRALTRGAVSSTPALPVPETDSIPGEFE